MRQHITRPWIKFGSALLVGLAGSGLAAAADSSASPAAPKQKALISFDGDFFSRWKSDSKVAESHPEGQQKALLPPNSIINRQYPPQSSPTKATPLPPTSLVVGQAVHHAPATAQVPQAQPYQAQPITTTLPAGAQVVQMAQAQSPFAGAQQPVVIMMPAGWQPDGSVTFAPRTVVSPEVPAEHWPSSQRNPFGDGDKKGLFSWPEVAKKMTSDKLREEADPNKPKSKALFAPSTEPAPAVAQSTSKALLAPKPAAPPVEAEPGKSRALFSFARKKEQPAATPAPALSPQMVDNTPLPPASDAPAMPQPFKVESTDASEPPPAAPTFEHARTEPAPASKAKQPKMNWRAKGSLAGSIVETETDAKAESVAAESESQTTAEVPAEPVVEATPEPAQVVEVTQEVQQMQQQPVAQTTAAPAAMPASSERSLLGKYFPQMVPTSERSPRTSRDPWQRQAQRDAATRTKAQAEPTSKALVPNIAAMIPGLDAQVQPASTTAPAASSDATVQRTPHYVTPSHATSARATHSYYAPPADHVVAEEARQEDLQTGSSRRNGSHSQGYVAEDETDQSDGQPEIIGEDPFHDRSRDQLAARVPVQSRSQHQTGYGTPSNGARLAQQKSTKGYRRLTGNDVAAGIARPFAAVSEFTKLPQAVTHMADGLQEETPLEQTRPQVVSPRPVKRYRLFDEPSSPSNTGEARRSRTPASSNEPSPATDADATEDVEEQTMPMRSGRRRLSSQASADENSPSDNRTTHIRNKHGVRVTIYSGEELAEEDEAEDRAAAYTAGERPNPLR